MSADICDMTPILGQAVGVYRERVSPGVLQRHFSRTWFHALPSGATRSSAIVPDGCADLIWANGTLRIAGPDRTAKIEKLTPGATVIGLRFQPGALARWLRVPASELIGARVRLEHFWGSEAQSIGDWVSEGRSVTEVAARLETVLAQRASTIDADDSLPGNLFRLIEAHDPLDGDLIRRLMAQTGMSERTLRRRSHEIFGYGPKMLDRILRFQRFMQLARAEVRTAGLAAIAAEAGYSDQAHLTRETRELAGFTPSAMLAQLNG
jgi:AraC-like DNA-binding protein